MRALARLAGVMLLATLTSGVVSIPSVAASTTTVRVVHYLAGAYRYKVVPHGGGAGFEQPSFDDSRFAMGDAAFGSGGNCPLDSTVLTRWPLNTDILLRQYFASPDGGMNVRVAVAIDNDIQVFVNGVDVSGGVSVHEGCASRDSFVFPVPHALLVKGGKNLLAVRAIDRGVISYVDLEVRVDILH